MAPLAAAGPTRRPHDCSGNVPVRLDRWRTTPWSTRIVQRLDGLPLAIEMAAAQLDTTTAEELADILDERLDDLRSPRRHVPSRHRSLADVLAWSEARLGDHEARTLAELSVFAGPVSAADIAGVLGRPAVADVVRQLARRSLVHVDRSRRQRASICSRRSVRSPGNASPRRVGPTRWRDATPNGSWTSRAAPTRSYARRGSRCR